MPYCEVLHQSVLVRHPKIAQLSIKTMDIHRFSSSHEIPPALPQFSGYSVAEKQEKINIKPQK